MSTRTITISGSNDNANLMIRPAKVYVCLSPSDPATDVYTHVGYTSEEVTLSVTKEYAELMQDGVLAEKAPISKAMNLSFELKQALSPDYLAIALGVADIEQDADVDPTWDQVNILAKDSGLPPEYAWKIETTTYDGRTVEAVIYRGVVTEVSDIMFGVASGTTDFAGLSLTIEAMLKDVGGVDKLGHIKAPVQI